jgi:glycosyltransferase involved in cell wall biosynthesis
MDLSIVTPCYNEEESVETFYCEVWRVIKLLKINCEVVFVNDGSTDNTLYSLRKIKKLGNVIIKIVNVEHNEGQSAALIRGLRVAKGGHILTIDVDLQQEPMILLDIWKYRNQFDIVQMIQEKRSDNWIKNILSNLFYRLIKVVTGFEFIANVGEFRMINRRVRDKILNEALPGDILRFIVQSLNFKTRFVQYSARKRTFGSSKYSFARMFNLAIKSIISSTNRPLYQVLSLGIFFTFSFFLYCLYAVIVGMQGAAVIGWTSTILLLGTGVIVIMIGLIVIGIYLAQQINYSREILKYIQRKKHFE